MAIKTPALYQLKIYNLAEAYDGKQFCILNTSGYSSRAASGLCI